MKVNLFFKHFFFILHIFFFLQFFSGIAAVYVAQTLGENLSMGKVFIIIVTSTISAIGTHGNFFKHTKKIFFFTHLKKKRIA